MKKVKSLFSIVIVLLVIFFFACSKDEDKATVGSVVKKAKKQLAQEISGAELLEKLPVDTIGFVFVNSGNDAFKRLLKSPLGPESNMIDYTKFVKPTAGPEDPSAQGAKEVFDFIGNLQTKMLNNILLPLKTNSKSRTTQAAFYIAGNKESGNLGVYFYSPEENFYIDNFENLKKEFAEMTLKEVPNPDFNIGEKRATLKFEDGKSPTSIYMASGKNYLSLGIDPKGMDRVFKDLKADEKYKLDTPEYKRLRERVGGNNDEISYGYVNIDIVRKYIDESSPPQDVKPYLALIPRQAFFSGEMNDKTFKNTWMAYIPQNDLRKDLQQLFSTKSSGYWEQIPESSFMAFNLNAGFLLELLRNIARNSKQDTADMQQVLAQIPEIPSNATIAISASHQNVTGFPDLQVILPAKAAVETIQKIKTLTAGAAGASQMPLQWQKADIAGKSVDYIPTPLGVGLYMTDKEESVLLATSEMALKSILEPNGAKLNVDASMQDPTIFFSAYFDYAGFYNVIKNLEGMINTFIPPTEDRATVDAFFAQMENYKNMGPFFMNTSYEQDFLALNMVNELK